MTSENELVELGRLLTIGQVFWDATTKVAIVVHIHDYFWVDVLCCTGRMTIHLAETCLL